MPVQYLYIPLLLLALCLDMCVCLSPTAPEADDLPDPPVYLQIPESAIIFGGSLTGTSADDTVHCATDHAGDYERIRDYLMQTFEGSGAGRRTRLIGRTAIWPVETVDGFLSGQFVLPAAVAQDEILLRARSFPLHSFTCDRAGFTLESVLPPREPLPSGLHGYDRIDIAGGTLRTSSVPMVTCFTNSGHEVMVVNRVWRRHRLSEITHRGHGDRYPYALSYHSLAAVNTATGHHCWYLPRSFTEEVIIPAIRRSLERHHLDPNAMTFGCFDTAAPSRPAER